MKQAITNCDYKTKLAAGQEQSSGDKRSLKSVTKQISLTLVSNINTAGPVTPLYHGIFI